MRTTVGNKNISKTTDLLNQIPFSQVKVTSYKRPMIRVALEHTTTLLPRGEGKGDTMFRKMLSKCAIFSRVLPKIVGWKNDNLILYGEWNETG